MFSWTASRDMKLYPNLWFHSLRKEVLEVLRLGSTPGFMRDLIADWSSILSIGVFPPKGPRLAGLPWYN
jgi:hypothetical protein